MCCIYTTEFWWARGRNRAVPLAGGWWDGAADHHVGQNKPDLASHYRFSPHVKLMLFYFLKALFCFYVPWCCDHMHVHMYIVKLKHLCNSHVLQKILFFNVWKRMFGKKFVPNFLSLKHIHLSTNLYQRQIKDDGYGPWYFSTVSICLRSETR